MPSESIVLVLYITGEGPRGKRAVTNLSALCEGALQGRCTYEVVDVLRDPGRAEQDRIMATPTLVRSAPAPDRRVIGDLSRTDDVLVALDIEL